MKKVMAVVLVVAFAAVMSGCTCPFAGSKPAAAPAAKSVDAAKPAAAAPETK